MSFSILKETVFFSLAHDRSSTPTTSNKVPAPFTNAVYGVLASTRPQSSHLLVTPTPKDVGGAELTLQVEVDEAVEGTLKASCTLRSRRLQVLYSP